tara:strand:- start:458 stop:706 length:249 start_codon:yes stop_codon:yes gene_type:complete
MGACQQGAGIQLEDTTMNNMTAMQTAYDMIAKNNGNANAAFTMANNRVPSIYSDEAFSQKSRFWIAVAQWIALTEIRKAKKS